MTCNSSSWHEIKARLSNNNNNDNKYRHLHLANTCTLSHVHYNYTQMHSYTPILAHLYVHSHTHRLTHTHIHTRAHTHARMYISEHDYTSIFDCRLESSSVKLSALPLYRYFWLNSYRYSKIRVTYFPFPAFNNNIITITVKFFCFYRIMSHSSQLT